MFREIFFVVIVFFSVNYSIGHKWIPMRSGDLIPPNAVVLLTRENTDHYNHYGQYNEVIKYVGRARHHNEVLLAEVNSTVAVVRSCGKQISKYYFDILVGENCRWVDILPFEGVHTDIVRGGTKADGEPVFVGKQYYQNPERMRIQPIYLEEPEFLKSPEMQALRCDDNNTWVDTPATNIPNNTVSAGKTADGNPIFVARLKSSCTTVPGQVTPAIGLATAAYKNENLRSSFCQVLVGENDQYEWISTQDGVIPDYAVVGGKDKNEQLLYVSRMNNTVRYIKHSTAAEMRIAYEILVQRY